MKLYLIHKDNFLNTRVSSLDNAVCCFDDTGVWVYSTFHDIRLSRKAAYFQTLTFLNEQLQLNGTIVDHRNFPLYLLVGKEEMFRLQLTILTYKEFDFEFEIK
jgi:hypothetical protein